MINIPYKTWSKPPVSNPPQKISQKIDKAFVKKLKIETCQSPPRKFLKIPF